MKKLQIIILVILIFCLTQNLFSQSKAENSFLGKWLTEDKNYVVEIYKENELFFGKVIKSYRLEDKNKDASMVEKVIKNMKLKNNVLSGGQVFDDESKKYFDGKIVIDGEKIKIKIIYMLMSFSETWIREK